VGGGILVHGVPLLHHVLQDSPFSWLANAAVGVVAGAVVLAGVSVVQKLRQRFID
jgi:uncharacterized protein